MMASRNSAAVQTASGKVILKPVHIHGIFMYIHVHVPVDLSCFGGGGGGVGFRDFVIVHVGYWIIWVAGVPFYTSAYYTCTCTSCAIHM